jgi:hypothetical protein
MSRIEAEPRPPREPVVTYFRRNGTSSKALASAHKPEASPWPTILRRSAFAIVFLGSSTALDQAPPPPDSHRPAVAPALAVKVAERSELRHGSASAGVASQSR